MEKLDKTELQREKESLIEEMISFGMIKTKKVENAFRSIKREEFMPESVRKHAYEDRPLPIYENQTISQPSTIAEMLEWLEVKEDSKILEIGTGCGYNAALISKLTKKTVYSLENIEKLVNFTRSNLKKAGIKNVEVIYADGTRGYSEKAPYDRIIATCVCDEIPNSWKEQLKEGGILVAPVGITLGCEIVVAKKINREFVYTRHPGYAFVELTKGKK